MKFSKPFCQNRHGPVIMGEQHGVCTGLNSMV
jgi:hypothetical protein